MADDTPRRPLSLGTRILAGLGCGIAAGLTVGERAAPLATAGDVFVGLLQMTVLPYIVVSLIANVGRLSLRTGRSLAVRAAGVWLALFAAGSVVLVAMSLAFPSRQAPSFFSTALLEMPERFDLVELFVPVNVFQSLVTNAVPGVVLFCLCVGAALIAIPEKDGVIRGLDAVGAAIARVNGFVVRLTPYGVFAIAAAAAGTMTLEEFGRLRGYLLVFALTSFLLAFGLLPLAVAACTPFGYRDALRACRDALVTAFATGKVIVVLPMLIENTKRLFEERQLRDPDVAPSVDVLYPLVYPFPYLGKLLALLFVPFAAAFVGRSLDLLEYPSLIGMGVLSMFGGPILAIPFLLETHELPADMFQLFLLSGVLTARLGDMVGVAHLFAFTAITVSLLTRSFRIRWRRVAAWGAAGGVLLAAVGGGSRLLLDATKDAYRRDQMLQSMHLMSPDIEVAARVLERAAPNPQPLRPGQSRLERIRERGVLRVGFNDDHLPFVFRNRRGELVGFDVEMAHRLAGELGVALEFVPFERDRLAQQLAADHFDLAMAGLMGTTERSLVLSLSDPYLEATLGMVVPDHRARELDTYEEITDVESLRVGILAESQFARALKQHVPQAEIEVVPSTAWFFTADHDLDALMMSAEAGSAWTILHPHFQVVVPTRRRVIMPLVYALPPGDPRLAEFIDFWISMARSTGGIADLYDYWIMGAGAEPVEPRWNVLDDVIGEDD